MERTKIFVSYSHRDRKWLDRLKVHLALLERKDTLHIWSDTRIDIGERWQEEIENALAESRIAVLLISPDFLASDFIWKEEMPKLILHQKQGLIILPLIARSCAWRLSSELAALQARPQDGRPLALSTDAEADLSLAEFVYELATRVQKLPEELPEALASEEADSIRAWRLTASGVSSRPLSISQPLSIGNEEFSPPTQDILPPIRIGQEWIGEYDATSRTFKLLIKCQEGQAFRGLMIYMDDETETLIKGNFAYTDIESLPQEARAAAQDHGIIDFKIIVRFQETNVQKQGHRSVQLSGEYIGFLGNGKIAGVYRSGEQVLGRFFFTKV